MLVWVANRIEPNPSAGPCQRCEAEHVILAAPSRTTLRDKILERGVPDTWWLIRQVEIKPDMATICALIETKTSNKEMGLQVVSSEVTRRTDSQLRTVGEISYENAPAPAPAASKPVKPVKPVKKKVRGR